RLLEVGNQRFDGDGIFFQPFVHALRVVAVFTAALKTLAGNVSRHLQMDNAAEGTTTFSTVAKQPFGLRFMSGESVKHRHFRAWNRIKVLFNELVYELIIYHLA